MSQKPDIKTLNRKRHTQGVDYENVHKEYRRNRDYKDMPDLEEKMNHLKECFAEYDKEQTEELDSVQLSDLLATKFGRHHNQLQLRRIIAEADTNQSGTIDYREFLGMMIGPNRSVLKTVLKQDGELSEYDKKPTKPPKKRDIQSFL